VDVGCGTGAFVRRLADLGARVTGVEPSPGMRDVAAARVPEAAIVDGHLASIPVGDGGADALISTYTVSHLPPAEQPAALAEMLRVVAARGPIVIVDVPVVPPDDLPRVREMLVASGRTDQMDWYARGLGLDLPSWRDALERTGRRVHVELLGPLVTGLAAVDPGGVRAG
jgi:ubiquinone/menaquinone biosynthesis C-methylase UbiE